MKQKDSITPEVRSFVYKQAWKFLIAGMLIFSGSIIATYLGYKDAENGGSYLLFWGAIAIGLGLILRAIYLFLKPERLFFGGPPNPVLMGEVSKGKFFLRFFAATFLLVAILFAFISESVSEDLIGASIFALFSATIATVFYWFVHRK
jgi:hypothetical protein